MSKNHRYLWAIGIIVALGAAGAGCATPSEGEQLIEVDLDLDALTASQQLLFEDFASLPTGPVPPLRSEEPGTPDIEGSYFALPDAWLPYGQVSRYHPVWAPEEDREPLPDGGNRWYATQTDRGSALTKHGWDVADGLWYGETSLPSNQWALAPLDRPIQLDGTSVYLVRMQFQFDNISEPFDSASESNRIDVMLLEGARPAPESEAAMHEDPRYQVTYRFNAFGEWGLDENLHSNPPHGDGPIDGHIVYREFARDGYDVRWSDEPQAGFFMRRDTRDEDLNLLPEEHIPESIEERANAGTVPGFPSRWGSNRAWEPTEGTVWETYWIIRGTTGHDHYVLPEDEASPLLSLRYDRSPTFAHDSLTHLAFLYRPEARESSAGGYGLNRTFIHEVEVRELVPGDLDLRGAVSHENLLALERNLGTEGGWLEGDITGTGRIGPDDVARILSGAEYLSQAPVYGRLRSYVQEHSE